MKVRRTLILIVTIFTWSVLTETTFSQPQSGIWTPDGCSVGLSPTIPGVDLLQDALDLAIAGACDRHDICYRNCPQAWGMGWYTHRLYCDNIFLTEFTAVCAAETVAQEVLNIGWESEDFIPVCEGIALTAYAFVKSSFGANSYKNNMCTMCANPYVFFYECDGHWNEAYHCNTACSPNYEWTCENGLNGTYDPIFCECYPPCPVIVDLDKKNIRLTDTVSGVYFDLNADGTPELTAWTEPGGGDAFLVLDRNLNGMIDDGKELFGTATSQPSSDERNGFLALKMFDSADFGGNGDGKITAEDEVFVNLRLWVDSNHDGESQAGELYSLLSQNIEKIDLNYLHSNKTDRYGNEFRYRSKVYYGGEGNKQKFAYDVFFVVEPGQ